MNETRAGILKRKMCHVTQLKKFERMSHKSIIKELRI